MTTIELIRTLKTYIKENLRKKLFRFLIRQIAKGNSKKRNYELNETTTELFRKIIT